jgi:hypothetical protein
MWIEIPATVSLVPTREVVSVEETDSLANLLQSMQALCFRHLPAADDSRLIGLLTERDLLRISTSSLVPHGCCKGLRRLRSFGLRGTRLRSDRHGHSRTDRHWALPARLCRGLRGADCRVPGADGQARGASRRGRTPRTRRSRTFGVIGLTRHLVSLAQQGRRLLSRTLEYMVHHEGPARLKGNVASSQRDLRGWGYVNSAGTVRLG